MRPKINSAKIVTKNIDAMGTVNAVATSENASIRMDNIASNQNVNLIAASPFSDLSLPEPRDNFAVYISANNGSHISFANITINNEQLIDRKHLMNRLYTNYYYRTKNQSIIISALQYFIPLDAKAELHSKITISLHNTVIQSFITGPQPLMLMLGEAGSGKSTYSHYLAITLWQLCQQDADAYIPILIEFKSILPLPPGQKNLGRFIETILEKNYGLTTSDIRVLKTYKIVFILDGYDEKLGEDYSVYTINDFGSWNAKVLFTCRTDHIQSNLEYRRDFKVRNYFDDFPVMYIMPFDRLKIDEYLKNIVCTSNITAWSIEQYQDLFNAHKELYEIIENPFLLSLAVTALPAVLANLDYEKVLREKHSRVITVPPFSRSRIIEAFLDKWFEKEAQRYNEKTGRTTVSLWEERPKKAKLAFNRFCQRIAWEMFSRDQTEIYYQEELDEDSYNSDDSGDDNPENKYLAQFLTNLDADVVNVRSGCPLRVDSGRCSFYHKIFMEYFIAQLLYNDFFNKTKIHYSSDKIVKLVNGNKIYLNKKLLSTHPEIAKLTAEFISGSHSKIEKLLELVKLSRPKILGKAASVLSSNAVTLLTKSRFNFSLQDFSGVDIPAAVFCGAICDSLNLADANVSQANFANAVLRRANFQNTIMKDVHVGILPSIVISENDEYIASASYSQDDLLIATAHGRTITIIDVSTRTIKDRIIMAINSDIRNIVFLPDSNRVVFTTRQDIGVFDFLSMRIQTIKTFDDDTQFHSITFDISYERKMIAIGIDRVLYLLEMETLLTLKSFEVFHSISKMLFRKNEDSIMVVSRGNGIRLYSLTTGYKTLEILPENAQGDRSFFEDLYLSYDEKYLFTLSMHRLIIWSLPNGRYVDGLEKYVDIGVMGYVATHPTKNLIAISSNKTRIFDLNTRQVVAELKHINRKIVFSKDGENLLVVSPCDVAIYNVQQLSLNQTTPSVSSYNGILSINQKIIISQYYNALQFRDVNTGQLVYEFSADAHEIIALAISKDGNILATLSKNRQVRVWNVQNKTLLGTFFSGTPVSVLDTIISGDLCLNRDGSMLIIAISNQLEIWNRVLLQQVFKSPAIRYSGYGEKVMLNSDETLIIYHQGNCIYRYPMANNRPFKCLFEMQEIKAVTISNSDILAIYGNYNKEEVDQEDNKIVLLTLNNLQSILTLTPPRDFDVDALTFNSEGNLLALSTYRRTVIYNLNSMAVANTLINISGKLIWNGDNYVELDYNNLSYWIKNGDSWHLEWRTAEYFDATEANISNVSALSADNKMTFTQNGAIEHNTTEDEFLHFEMVVDRIVLQENISIYSSEALFKAVEMDEIDKVTIWLTDDNKVFKNEKGQSLLHVSQSIEMTELLLNFGISAHVTDLQNKTPLHSAAEKNYYFIVVGLIARHVDVDAKDNDGRTALHCAVLHGHNEFLTELLKFPVDLNARDNNLLTPLHLATARKSLDFYSQLVIKGAVQEAKDSTGRTPLLYTVSTVGHTISKQIKLNANQHAVDADGNTLYHLIALEKYHLFPFSYRKLSVDINQINAHGKTALHLLISSPHLRLELLKEFIKYGVKINVPDLLEQTPWFYIVIYWHYLSIQPEQGNGIFYMDSSIKLVSQVAMTLIAAGADINAQAHEGLTVLHLAIQSDNIDALKAMLEYGVNPNICTDAGDNCLHFCVTSNKPELLKTLLVSPYTKHLLNSKNPFSERTVLEHATVLERTDCIALLNEFGADENLKNTRHVMEDEKFKQIPSRMPFFERAHNNNNTMSEEQRQIQEYYNSKLVQSRNNNQKNDEDVTSSESIMDQNSSDSESDRVESIEKSRTSKLNY